MVKKISGVAGYIPVSSSEKSEALRKRLGEVKGFINQLDSPEDLSIEKLRVVFDLIDDELIKEYDRELKELERFDLEQSCLTSLNTRRSEMEILAFMLTIMRRGAIKTKILYQANLSYTQLKSYLQFLKDAGLITEEGGKKRGNLFKTTYNGNLFLYHWSKILSLIEKELPSEEPQELV